ncbi:TlpA family protein disulfide reductase [Flagellimonas hymeniacidonis]|uniref:TlpA family protein disulfide reductase n=1 Tax=Flagellimonas hymeniacidonis TaxID=2603628 RepID=A0A5C8V1L5_9FLAO|nr:TlpA disulfide reductase family protein [Flagellimonas hymeniacidonis]TXN35490.1 TlpA family protein disulfide reductase [Flagellimonas hymeniacidonis]
MKRIWFLAISFMLLFSSCEEEQKELLTGKWWAKLDVSETEELPFNFTLSESKEGGYRIEMYNADETVLVDEIEINNDSIHIKMPIFEGYISGVFSENEIRGDFIKESLERIVPFKAVYGERDRFEANQPANNDISGIWETYFDVDTEDEYPAKGIFMQNGNKVNGTFRTTTGDYRYLEGTVSGDTLKLSTFDGAHAFLFTARVTDSTLQGHFYSGNHSVEKFVARRNEAFELPDANTLTFLKDGYDSFDFSFPDEAGNLVSLSDARFENKVVLVQIMGTWCPNCLDETRFYVDFLNENPELDVEFVALAFEYAKTQEKAFEGIARLKKRVGVEYPILLAQFGSSSKQKANEKLPMLNHVLSYPTTIYMDKNGAVNKIHTGFNGPATGRKFEEFKKEFSETISMLTEETVELK